MRLDFECLPRGDVIADPVAQLGRKRATRLLDVIGVRIQGEDVRGLFGDAECQPPVATAELEHTLLAEVAEAP